MSPASGKPTDQGGPGTPQHPVLTFDLLLCEHVEPATGGVNLNLTNFGHTVTVGRWLSVVVAPIMRSNTRAKIHLHIETADGPKFPFDGEIVMPWTPIPAAPAAYRVVELGMIDLPPGPYGMRVQVGHFNTQRFVTVLSPEEP